MTLATGLALAMDKALVIAFDKDSVRTKDVEGRLHVAVTNISKANICAYLGREIPDWQDLGLQPDKIYQLLRDPEELAKAAPSFNNIPLLSRHVPVNAEDHQPDLVIGSTGTDAEFSGPHLRNSLVVWAKSGIDDIESETKKELSSAYRYRADMTPGTFAGAKYDGVMRDIVGNHVALVREGRAGSDVVVGDAKSPAIHQLLTEASKMAKLSQKAALAQGALLVFLKPKMAQDAKLDLTAVLSGVTAKNFKDKKAGIFAGLKKQLAGKIAQDADIDDVVDLLDSLEKIDAPDVIETAIADDPNSAVPLKKDDEANDDDPLARVKAFLKGKISDEDLAKLDAMMAAKGATDAETDEDKKKREAAEKTAKDAETAKVKDMVTKPAMDAAIAEAVKHATETATKTQREIREAENDVRPYVGALAMAFDSAEAVYRTALKSLNVEGLDGIKEVPALKAILKMQPLPGAKQRKDTVAMDAASVSDFSKRYPDAARIHTV